MSPMRAILVLVALVPIIGLLLALANMAGVSDFMFAGFLFILYWMGLKGGAPGEYLPALAGSLGGLSLAFLMSLLPSALGTPGAVLGGIGLALSVYLLIRGQASWIANNAFMIMLTVASSIAFKTQGDYAAAAIAICLSAAYVGGIVFLGTYIATRGKARATTEHRPAPADL